jgi:hypothetical protein
MGMKDRMKVNCDPPFLHVERTLVTFDALNTMIFINLLLPYRECVRPTTRTHFDFHSNFFSIDDFIT